MLALFEDIQLRPYVASLVRGSTNSRAIQRRIRVVVVVVVVAVQHSTWSDV
jgi:hypothetical protein